MKKLVKHHHLQILEAKGKRHVIEVLLYFTLKEAKLSSTESKQLSQLLESESDQLGEKAMGLLQHKYNEGIEKGAQQEKLNIAKSFLQDGIDERIVAHNTNLSLAKIKQIKKNLIH